MDFQLSDDQRALQEGIRSFCDGRVPLDALKGLEEKFDRALWSELAEMGVFSLRQPESRGGIGLGAADAVLVFAELGRRLVPGPLVWSHLLADRIDGAARGETAVGGIDLLDPRGGPVLVEHLGALDALVVLREGGVYRLDPRALRAEPVAVPLDPHTPVAHVRELPSGEKIGDAADAQRLRLEGAALTAGLLLGVAEASQELATAYAKHREQFARVIGSFQAMKHLLADAFVRQELARAAVYAAGATLDQPEVGSALRAVAAAKLAAGEAALKNARCCVQVHGGMGYTWEIPAHYYLKRAIVLENAFGSSEEHSERMAELLVEG
ncbi:MAG TPA: acyl-CoA dehydrogenase family protein [Myxococcota bacterium]|nr:acyl-CoA dehydrogenase family protein [Myxococcota bacterium]